MNQQVLEQAAQWFVRLRTEEPSAEDCSAWFSWIEMDPEHRSAFAQIQQSWDISGVMTSPVWPTPEELAAAAVDARAAPPPAQPLQRGRSRFIGPALAAGIAVAILSLVLLMKDGDRISTDRGEQQSAVLDDGSRIELGGLTDVAIRFTPTQRLVVAGEGETFYRVARDPRRPFVVRSGPLNITALGTEFFVRREGTSVSVAVSEGLVEVESVTAAAATRSVRVVRAGAGQRVRFEEGALSMADERASSEGWRFGRLRFEDEPLRVVVASINRYAPQPIEITDPALEELHFTGTVFDESIDRWLDSMEVVFPVSVRKDGTRVVIEPAGR